MKMKKAKANAKKLQEDSNNKNKNRNKEEVEEETVTNLLLFNITSCLLLIQPDHSTVWSDRRRCLLLFKKEENDILLMWYNELDYLDLLMTQHSKAYVFVSYLCLYYISFVVVIVVLSTSILQWQQRLQGLYFV